MFEPCTGLVLGGAAAMGAYEVGVLSYVYDAVVPEAAGPEPSVFCGTSAGAINATALAAYADEPLIGTALLARSWRELELSSVLRPSIVEILSMLLDVTGSAPNLRRLAAIASHGGLLDSAGVAALVARIPFERLAGHMASGYVRGVAVGATRVADGCNTLFYASDADLRRTAEANVRYVPAQLRPEHVLASAAIPMLFPAVEVDGEPYVDGGLRQIVPLSSASRLGARRLLVINSLSSQHVPIADPPIASPLYLAGKALNALFADRIEVDIAHVRRLDAIIRAGTARFGPEFPDALNEQLAAHGEEPFEELRIVSIEPTRDLGVVAADYVRSELRPGSSPIAALLHRVADSDPQRVGDLLAFILFDAGFTSALIDLGRSDARARHAEIAGLFAP